MPSTATTAPPDPSRAEISRAGCAYSWRRIPNRRRCSASSITPRTRWRYYAIDQRDLIRVSLEGDFGFSPPNATAPAPEVGHEVKLINFNQQSRMEDDQGDGQQQGDKPLALKIQNFARNDTGDQAFISPGHTAGFNRPLNVRFGPDGCAYVVDYGAVRDVGADTHFVGPPQNGPLLQIPGTGVIWKICKQ